MCSEKKIKRYFAAGDTDSYGDYNNNNYFFIETNTNAESIGVRKARDESIFFGIPVIFQHKYLWKSQVL